VLLKTPYRELAAVFSPDARWIAYMSNESGRMEIYVRPFVNSTPPGVGGQWQISFEGGVYPRWRRDGKELYFLNSAGDMMAAPIVIKAATLEAGAPLTLFKQRVFADGIPDSVYDVSPNGRFLVNTVIDRGLAPITLMMNWKPRDSR
jgi:eukaryotic-like serine/threonine-protein kinase